MFAAFLVSNKSLHILRCIVDASDFAPGDRRSDALKAVAADAPSSSGFPKDIGFFFEQKLLGSKPCSILTEAAKEAEAAKIKADREQPSFIETNGQEIDNLVVETEADQPSGCHVCFQLFFEVPRAFVICLYLRHCSVCKQPKV